MSESKPILWVDNFNTHQAHSIEGFRCKCNKCLSNYVSIKIGYMEQHGDAFILWCGDCGNCSPIESLEK